MNSSGNWRVFQATVWQPLRAHLGRTTLAVIAIALGVALGLGIFLMTRAATAQMTRASRSLFGEADLSVQGTAEGFDESLYPVIARISGVAVASPIVEVRARVVGQREALTIMGMDFLRALQLQPAITTAPRGRANLSIFDANSIQLNASAAKTLHVDNGDSIIVQVGTRPVTFKVANILPGDAYRQDVGLLDIAAAQWRLDKLGKLTRIDIRLAADVDAATVAKAITQSLPTDAKLTTPSEESQLAAQLRRPLAINLLGVAMVALFTGVFLVYSTQSLAIVRRRREFALLRALGITTREQIASVLYAGGLLGVIGATLGVALGIALAKVGLQFIPGNSATQAQIVPQIVPMEIATFALLGLLASLAGSVAPALAVARIPTSQALKAGNVEQSSTRGHFYVALMLWLLAVPLLFAPPLFDLPIFGYTAIAFILFGAVLLIPACTRFVLTLLPLRPPICYQTAIAQLRGVAHTATTSVATMLVSVSLMVAMSIMGASLRGSMAQWSERMFPADVSVQMGPSGVSYLGMSYLDTKTANALTRIPGVDRSEAVRAIPILLSTHRAPITLIARPTHSLALEATAQHELPQGAIPVWINRALADRERLAPDSILSFNLAGREVTGSVRGVWRDFFNANGALVINYDHYVNLTGDDRISSLGIWITSGASLENIVRMVRERIGHVDVDIALPGENRAKILRGFDSLFAIIYLLLAVSVLIGLFGIGVNTSAQVLARRAEFGVLRHLGFTRGQIGLILSIEGLCLGTLGVLSGLLVGSVISAVMILIVTPQSFHWTMDLHVPATTLLALAIALPLASALTALWSGRSAMNDDVIRAVKEDW